MVNRHALATGKLDAFNKGLPLKRSIIEQGTKLEKELDQLATESKIRKQRVAEIKQSRQGNEANIKSTAAEIKRITDGFGGLDGDAIEQRISELEKEVAEARLSEDHLQTWSSIAKLSATVKLERAELGQTKATSAALASEQQSVGEQLIKAKAHLREQSVLTKAYQLDYRLQEEKANLTEGDPCPVCGALEHPALSDFQPVSSEEVEYQEAKLTAARTDERDLEKKATELATKLVANRTTAKKIEARLKEAERQLDAFAKPQGDPTRSVDEIAAELISVGKARRVAEQQLASLRSAVAEMPRLRKLEAAIDAHQAAIAQSDLELKALSKQLAKSESLQQELLGELRNLLTPATSVEQYRTSVAREEKELLASVATSNADLGRAATAWNSGVQQLADAKEKLAQITGELNKAAIELNHSLVELALSETEARALSMSATEEQNLRNSIIEVEKRKDLSNSNLKTAKEKLEQAQMGVRDLSTEGELSAKATDLSENISTTEQSRGAIRELLRQDDLRVKAIAAGKEKLEHLARERNRWARLDELIGSASGKKFRGFAQAITLQRLVDMGNDHLLQIAPRYRMEYEAPQAGGKEELNMVIVDQYQNDNRRTMATLSGGESFLISLALALGLSDLASGKSLIQSLFIDEGFGTLDGTTLDQAMTTLEGLRERGKTIGLISHVASLKERIPCQIVVKPIGEGFSTIEVVA